MKKKILFICGWISFILGLIGIPMPILPTTPFFLLAAWLFAQSSEKWDAWLKSTKVYKRYVVAFKEQGGVSISVKIEMLAFTYGLMLISWLFVSHPYIRLMLIGIALMELIVVIRLPGVPREKRAKEENIQE
ncbi:YbaN family protein [Bacillus sp. 1P06AnD]|uniref:YbaN family protein n=1 Tax=Bacillus sp. 1P06AnD TaxID=3132208 RepID=UPI0039A270F5